MRIFIRAEGHSGCREDTRTVPDSSPLALLFSQYPLANAITVETVEGTLRYTKIEE